MTLRGAEDVAAGKGALGIGARFVLGDTVQRSPLDAIRIGAQRTVEACGMVLGALRDLVVSVVSDPGSAPPVSGPIGIAQAIGTVRTQAPPVVLFWLVAVLSANLAVVNILPFPPLDGGRVAVALIQAVDPEPDQRPPGARDLLHRLPPAHGLHPVGQLLRHRPGGHRRVTEAPEAPPEVPPPRPALALRRSTPTVLVGGVPVGSAHPVVVQSMTNTDTADADATALQVAALAHAGSELVRITVNNDAAARAVPEIAASCATSASAFPIVGDFHYNGHQLLVEFPEMARGARQVPHQPRQRRGEAPPRRELPGHRAGRGREREARPHRGELGLARPGAAGRPDGRERPSPGASTRPRRDDRGDGVVCAPLRRAGGGDRPAPRPHHPLGQGVGRPGPGRRVPALGGALRLPAPPGPHRGGHGHEGHRGLVGRPLPPPRRGHRRHYPGLADARPGRRPGRRGPRRPADPAVAGAAQLRAAGLRVPRLRPHDQHVLPGDGRGDPGPPARTGCPSGRRAIRAWRSCAWR